MTTDEQVWLAVYAAVAASSNCVNPEVAISWADRGLAEFRKRFPAPAEPVKLVKRPDGDAIGEISTIREVIRFAGWEVVMFTRRNDACRLNLRTPSGRTIVLEDLTELGVWRAAQAAVELDAQPRGG